MKKELGNKDRNIVYYLQHKVLYTLAGMCKDEPLLDALFHDHVQNPDSKSYGSSIYNLILENNTYEILKIPKRNGVKSKKMADSHKIPCDSLLRNWHLR